MVKILNTWRVDRTERQTPCGVNSIRYLGDSEKAARKTYNETTPGLDAWNQPDPQCGVLLSKWNSRMCNYVLVEFKK